MPSSGQEVRAFSSGCKGLLPRIYVLPSYLSCVYSRGSPYNRLSCYAGRTVATPLPLNPNSNPEGVIMVLGDSSSFSNHFRIAEYATLATWSGGAAVQPPIIPPGRSTSVNFSAPSSPINGVNAAISQGDFNPQALYQCIREDSTDHANMSNVTETLGSAAANQAFVTFSGAASESPLRASTTHTV
jgi:hypothetical protein